MDAESSLCRGVASPAPESRQPSAGTATCDRASVGVQSRRIIHLGVEPIAAHRVWLTRRSVADRHAGAKHPGGQADQLRTAGVGATPPAQVQGWSLTGHTQDRVRQAASVWTLRPAGWWPRLDVPGKIAEFVPVGLARGGGCDGRSASHRLPVLRGTNHGYSLRVVVAQRNPVSLSDIERRASLNAAGAAASRRLANEEPLSSNRPGVDSVASHSQTFPHRSYTP